MTTTTTRAPLSWSARLLIGLVLILVGAAAMTWALANYPPVAKLLGVSTAPPPARMANLPRTAGAPAPAATSSVVQDARVAALEARLARVESLTNSAAGTAGRADALLIAFAARRAIDRGVALGFLENLLVQRFGGQHQAAVSTIITASRQPVTLSTLSAEFEQIGPELRRGGTGEGWWTSLSRELGAMVQVRRADRPAPDLNARYQRALHDLSLGQVDRALAEVMRMPGAGNAGAWIAKARRYVAAHRALDELESAALLGSRAAG